MLILVAKEMISASLIHAIIVVIVLTCGKHLVVHVKGHILEILVNTVRFSLVYLIQLKFYQK